LCQLFLGKNEAMESDGAKRWSQAHGKRNTSNQTGTDFQVDIVDSWYDSKSKGRSQQPPLLHKSSHLWQPSRLATKSNRMHSNA
jgi:hypothetical protein